jgi:hypothetical protein
MGASRGRPAGFGGVVDAQERALHVADDEPAEGFGDPVGGAAVDEGQMSRSRWAFAGDEAGEDLSGEVGRGNALAGVTAGEGEFAGWVEADGGGPVDGHADRAAPVVGELDSFEMRGTIRGPCAGWGVGLGVAVLRVGDGGAKA